MQGGFITLPGALGLPGSPSSSGWGDAGLPLLYFLINTPSPLPFNILILNSYIGVTAVHPTAQPTKAAGRADARCAPSGGLGHMGWGEAMPAATLAALMKLSL